MDVLAPYRARTVELPETLRRADVGAAAWWRLLDDGVVRSLWGDVAIAADLEETPARRSGAIAELVPARGVVGRRSAVWLHTGQCPPRRIDVLVPTRTRRADPHPLRVTAESTFAADDVIQVGSVRATTVQRTGLDICRHLPLAQALELLEPLLAAGFDPALARTQLEQLGGHRGILGAREVLRHLTDPPEPAPRAQVAAPSRAANVDEVVRRA
ncbi:hypothetical protein [Cellulomonas sp. URHE0023]|uniref:hypothetical protein n=1 Tax=Cellulomonas sp. URHE0023 TaxID=1380354 RepID=UPI0004848CB9|nr:hypothetical protein [Cellulomonas sp. URHE0023]